jgi:formylglycine-generating enzyme required for sulfatase activity
MEMVANVWQWTDDYVNEHTPASACAEQSQ